MASKITIHNRSDKTASLIPFSRHNNEKLESQFKVEKNLARTILAGKAENVELKKYRVGDEVKNRQIYMLFRVGEIPDDVEPKATEELFLHTRLAKSEHWDLRPDGEDKVIARSVHAADQTSSGANAAESQLERLNKQVQELLKKVEDLEKRLAELEKARA